MRLKSGPKSVRRWCGLTIAAGLAAAPLAAGAQRVGPVAIALERAAESLGPGQYVWRDDDLSLGAVSLVIDRTAQVAFAYRGATLIGVATVSTGKPGKRTPLGEFTILQKKVFHRSNIYSNAPMPYMQRLTWDGIALHAGVNPGYPASHGCIRLPNGFAQLLYGVTRMGASVAVVDDGVLAPVPRQDFPLIIADVAGLDDGSFTQVVWSPDADTPLLPPEALRPSTGLSVLGDEWMVPDSPLTKPARRRWRL